MVIEEKRMTVETFWEKYGGKSYELIDGRVSPVTPTGYLHGAVTARILARLGDFVDAHELGEVVGGETGFFLADDFMRAVDAAFISREKLAQITDPVRYLPFAPDLAVEVVSPSDQAEDIRQKVDAYLRAGTALVWVIYPTLRQVIVHQPDGTARTVQEHESLDGGAVLPGLALPVATLFPPETGPVP